MLSWSLISPSIERVAEAASWLKAFLSYLWRKYSTFCIRPLVTHILQSTFLLLLCLISKARCIRYERELIELKNELKNELKRKDASGEIANNRNKILSEYETYSVNVCYSLIMVGVLISVCILLYILKYRKYTLYRNLGNYYWQTLNHESTWYWY